MSALQALATISFADSLRGCIFGIFVGDSLAMPVHWYYNLRQLQYDFNGGITKYESAKYPFPGSIMNLSNTGGGGRGSDKGTIIGNVINHGKHKYWKKGGQYHYHHGLKAGENTLDAQIVRVLTASIISNKQLKREGFLKEYVEFMTTKGSHNDVYASTAHRMFFANWIQQKPLNQCPDSDGHNIDTIDALTVVPPLVASMALSAISSKEIKSSAWSLICSLRKPSKSVRVYVDNYVDLLYNVLMRRSLNGDNEDEEKEECNSEWFRSEILRSAEQLGVKEYVLKESKLKSDPMVACYLSSSYPAMLVYAYKYY